MRLLHMMYKVSSAIVLLEAIHSFFGGEGY